MPDVILVCTLFRLPGSDDSAFATIPQWIDHYRRLGVDEVRSLINVRGDPGLPALLRDHGLPVTEVVDVPLGSSARRPLLVDMIRARNPDWYIKADPDEFQDYPLPLTEILEHMRRGNENVVVGQLVDYCAPSGEIITFDPALPIAHQFCCRTNVPARLCAARRKVMLARGDVRLKVSGAHAAIGERPSTHRGEVRHYPYHGDLSSRTIPPISASFVARRTDLLDWYARYDLFGRPRGFDPRKDSP